MSVLKDPAWLAVIIAAVSALIAVIAILVARATAKQQIELARQQTELVRKQAEHQQQMTVLEESRRAEELQAQQRADVFAEMASRPPRITSKGPKERDPVLRLRNRGKALAHKVDCEVVPVEGTPSPPIVHGLERLPVDLHPDQPLDFLVSRGMGMGPLRVAVSWVDDTGPHREPFDL